MAIDTSSQSITIIDRKDYVIDSVILTGHAKTYLCQGLVRKEGGHSRILLRSESPDYKIYSDSMDSLVCMDEPLNLDIILRKLGDTTAITNAIARGYNMYPRCILLTASGFVPCCDESCGGSVSSTRHEPTKKILHLHVL